MLAKLVKNLSSLPGWRSNRKIVVIESDDWGSIRMSSSKAYQDLVSAGVTMGEGVGVRYNKYDTFASKEDLSFLYETLNSVKDKNGHATKMTAICLSANPDFDKIKENGFNNYYYEPFTKTLEKYNIENTLPLWNEGYNSNIFVPEFHGREHLNIYAWLRALQAGDKEALLAFDHGVWGYNRKKGIDFQATFDLEYASDLEGQKEAVKDGLRLFEELHGRKATFFVPPNGPINNQLEKVAADGGITYMSSPKIQKEVLGEGKIKKHFRYIGKKNEHNQTYITRNVFFEPSKLLKDEINSCLSQIEIAFKWKKPAVISSHRVNYIGGLEVSNRDNGLNQLRKLLKAIVKKWPDVEFMTSTELGQLINKK
ncbi:polysaccharide (de)acetylase [Flavobacterium arcticum]|uniref:Polysaccharide (De)acetylase n=1 Tax=Flavobacterium arcticum TaxID=1784713 RepID=A0A345H993_9FLAO|nr:polysaccharide (de)acetylase [Flavobacterium arcticum]AXG73153.1 polysaccharide (de)acetylase [Flavobacterium arcticum]KAF2512945.1 polysaccharide (de)acetylase [Flavobacterium arcticum]